MGLLLVVFGFGVSGGRAAIVDSASCSTEDISVAIARAVDGDVVRVPPGTCTWNSDVVIDKKAIVLQGAGTDATIIRNGEKDNHGTLLITASRQGTIRITGFSFDLNDTSADSGLRFIMVDGQWTDKKVRIDHCNFRGNGNWSYYSVVEAHAYILADHCLFDNIRKDVFHLFGERDGSWTSASSLGTDKNHFIEDCTVVNLSKDAALLDAYEGARYVVRHNHFTDSSLVNHGKCTSSPGVRQYEIYGNTFAMGDWRARAWVPDNWLFIRGGTGVIYDNTMEDLPWQKGEIKFAEYKLGVGGASCGAVGTEWCCCNYPCSQQVGRGQNDQSDPLYVWNNSVNGNNFDGGLTFANSGTDGRCDTACGRQLSAGDFIQANRDYMPSTARPGYTPYTYPHPLAVGASAPHAPANLRTGN